MPLTIQQAETALLTAAVKHTEWIETVGFHTRIFMVAPDFDCTELPPEFEILWHDAKECVICERIDDLKDFFKSLWPDRSN